jgi:predicted nuclease with TOPRIM domain|nr:MAG TPA: hypothetical protein [Bacteriophage sp.]
MADIKEVKQKFETVQGINKSLNEDLIRVESELENNRNNYKEVEKELLELTEANTIKAAEEAYNKIKSELDKTIADINKELSEYLDTYGENNE